MTTITKAELIELAKSANQAECRRGYALFQAWIKAAPRLNPMDQLNATERMLLTRIFASRNLPGK
jgi:hypothetical protein